jgi:hypothetical protein
MILAISGVRRGYAVRVEKLREALGAHLFEKCPPSYVKLAERP